MMYLYLFYMYEYMSEYMYVPKQLWVAQGENHTQVP